MEAIQKTKEALLGLLKVDSGEIAVNGEPVVYGNAPTNRHIGYLPDVPEFYRFMTAREYLRFCGEISGMKRKDQEARTEELLKLVGLSDEKHRIKGYSRGMKQRLGVAQALLNTPRLLICDEPTSALDPIGRRELLDLLAALSSRTTVLFSTHILSDVEQICTDVAFLNDGKIVRRGSVSDVKKLLSTNEFSIKTENAQHLEILLENLTSARRIARDEMILSGGEEAMHTALSVIAEKKLSVLKIERIEPSLEAVFLEVAK